MTSSFTHSDSPIDRASLAILIASSAVRQPAVLGRIRIRFQSMTSRMVFFLGSSRSSRRSATVTTSQPDASSAASIVSLSAYLPVPRKRRDLSSTPAMTRRSAVAVCTASAYRVIGLDSPHPDSALRARSDFPMDGEESLRQVLLLHELLVAGVGEALDRIVSRQPLELVDLDPRPETPALGFHQPVASDLVAAAPVDVRSAAEGTLDLTAKAGLLADLAQGAVLGRLVRLDLALGQGPVVVGGAMDDCELRLTRLIRAVNDATRRPYHVHIGQLEDFGSHHCSFVCLISGLGRFSNFRTDGVHVRV